ncbi:MAG: hypothetical protein ACXWQR_16355 [Ktedonobacterales bacterium]
MFKAVLIAHLPPFLELFFREEAAQLDLGAARFVDGGLFAAPPMGPERKVDLLIDIPLRLCTPVWPNSMGATSTR